MVHNQIVFSMKLIGGGGRESIKILDMINIPWQDFEKNPQKLKHMQASMNIWQETYQLKGLPK